tara:strand:+ start:336 stop:545 length:210 start_codon:yes stop_codon:yes gene_type:complete
MPNNEEETYGGIGDGLVDILLKRLGVSDELVQKIVKITEGLADNVEVQQIGDETIFTINLNKLHIRFKK